jgi:hypothetical protein
MQKEIVLQGIIYRVVEGAIIYGMEKNVEKK